MVIARFRDKDRARTRVRPSARMKATTVVMVGADEGVRIWV